MNRTAALVIVAFVLAFLFYLNNRPGYRSHRSLLDDIIDTINGRYGGIVGGDVARIVNQQNNANGATIGGIATPGTVAPFSVDVNAMVENVLAGKKKATNPNALPAPPKWNR